MLNTFCSDLLKYMLKHILLHLIPHQRRGIRVSKTFIDSLRPHGFQAGLKTKMTRLFS